uniref:Uncharacterized protein n=1 Tax=Anguilla anguilla TaxID=7936 RepID=A0A0E9S1A5_ANGAN
MSDSSFHKTKVKATELIFGYPKK